ncbi:transmembrane and coiled-coil domain-containing protein 4-like isoform X2 [Oryza brachyantha]|uniref:transmembrane and coiled-coil domain-containing protein 4-like isoform X2 n=1 Tax=Oryza brachyantha TaxID=4533 RepID=UPI001ADB3A93|nr:transmembrane and coiled-coil domain-containing protein 4-like isoform X2 [Oryza brachyantha]
MATSSTLSQTQRYAAGALLALALRQAQIHQSVLLGSHGLDDDPAAANPSLADHVDARHLWTHDSHGLLRPVLRFLEIDHKAWPGVETTAATSDPKHHIGAVISSKGVRGRGRWREGGGGEVRPRARPRQGRRRDGDGPRERRRRGRRADDRRQRRGRRRVAGVVAGRQPRQGLPEDGGAVHAPLGVRRRREHGGGGHGVSPRQEGLRRPPPRGSPATRHLARRQVDQNAKEEEQSRGNESPNSRWENWKRGGIIGAAALTGGTLMAISGGLAAPAIAAGFTALAPTLHTLVPLIGASGFAAIATAAGHTAGSVAVAASFGAAGAGLTGTKMAKRIGSVKEFEFKAIGENHNQGRLAVAILVTGFAFTEEDYIKPWEGWKTNLERYILQWESKHIIGVSTAIRDWLASRFAMELMREGAMQTVLCGIVSAFAWPAYVVSAADFIDSKWSIAIDRSDKAGKILAEVLLKGLQGSRPVTLIGFSLGARVVFKCLQELALLGNNEGIVERAVLIGAPVSDKGELWEPARKMVAGRFVNVYSTNDWILGITFRASLLTQGLAGIQAVHVPGVENVDVTELVVGHSSYLTLVKQILDQLELNTYYPVFYPSTPRSK